MIGPEHERAQPPTGRGFTDAVTFAFGDERAGRYGMARLGLSLGEDQPAGSALAVLFAERQPVTAVSRGGLAVPEAAEWERLALGGVSMETLEPLRRWRVALDGAEHGFDLTFEALGPPAEVTGGEALARAGGMAGYEHACRVTGRVRTGGQAREVRCLGQRGHAWGEQDWDRIDIARTVAAWPGEGPALALSAIRPHGALSHAEEPTWAALLAADGPQPVAEPRLSTTYDGDGRQRRAGLELWVHEEDAHPRRGSGEVLCGSTLDLGQLRLDCAFFRWRLDGAEGVGRYDVLRRAAA